MMEPETPVPSEPNWQTALNPALTARLARPLQQTGMVAARLGRGILNRAQALGGGSALGTRLLRRLAPPADTQTPQLPIVYPQRSGLPADTPAMAAAVAPPPLRPVVVARLQRAALPPAQTHDIAPPIVSPVTPPAVPPIVSPIETPNLVSQPIPAPSVVPSATPDMLPSVASPTDAPITIASARRAEAFAPLITDTPDQPMAYASALQRTTVPAASAAPFATPSTMPPIAAPTMPPAAPDVLPIIPVETQQLVSRPSAAPSPIILPAGRIRRRTADEAPAPALAPEVQPQPFAQPAAPVIQALPQAAAAPLATPVTRPTPAAASGAPTVVARRSNAAAPPVMVAPELRRTSEPAGPTAAPTGRLPAAPAPQPAPTAQPAAPQATIQRASEATVPPAATLPSVDTAGSTNDDSINQIAERVYDLLARRMARERDRRGR